MLRRIQRTGVTSLAVTLPKPWTEAHNVHSGTLVRFEERSEGHLDLSLEGSLAGGAPLKVLHIDATDAPPQILARLLVGAYITGQDQVVLVSRKELPAAARDEVDQITRRVLGMSLIEDEPSRLEVQVFLDPTKHRLPGLVDRVVGMIRLELELCESALAGGSLEPLDRVAHIEEEIDRFYLLMARQLLLASNDFRIAREIGVASHHYQLGYRLVAKMLEVTADLTAAIALELRRARPTGPDAGELRRLLRHLDSALVGTMHGFSKVSPCDAHAAMTAIEGAQDQLHAATTLLIRRSRTKEAAAGLQRVLSGLATALEMLRVVNEVTLNRAVEPETVARLGGRPLVLRTANAATVARVI